MKSLVKMEFHGSECSRRTHWQTWPSWGLLHFSDGTTYYLPNGQDFELAGLNTAKALGVDTSDYERKRAEFEKSNSYPPKPESAELYQHDYGYEKPVELGNWQWSTTFGRWGRFVRFADGWSGFTYPKV